MKNIEEQKELLWLREKYLIIMQTTLKAYVWSKDERLTEYAKYFGKESEKLKIKLKNL